MPRILVGILMLIGTAGLMAGSATDGVVQVTEITAGSAMSAIALLSGGLIVLRARRRP